MYPKLKRADRIAIIAPHPDDETLGCGLLIADAVRIGVPLAIVILTDGQASHPGSRRWPPAVLAKLRQSEARKAIARLGARHAMLRFMRWPDGRLAEAAKPLRLRRLLHKFGATKVFVTSPRDFHPDHQAAWRLTLDATRGTSASLSSYEVWSRLGQLRRRARHPGVGRKRWAMLAHRSQISPYISDDPEGFTFEAKALDHLIRSEEFYRIVSKG